MSKPQVKTTYEKWMEQEEIPIVQGYGISNVRQMERRPWKRTGGKGAFIQLNGMEGVTAQYVVEIAPGGALNAERHLYEEVFYVLNGNGSMQLWHGNFNKKHSFEWQVGSLFAAPLNTSHQLFNGSGSEPALLLATTSAPVVMDLFRDLDFVFGTDHVFPDRYEERDDYFKVGERHWMGDYIGMVWETNFIPDLREAVFDAIETKGWGQRTTRFEMAGNVLTGHMNEFPAGTYHKAHAHSGGAVLLGLQSTGYTLMWPPEAGVRPYENGFGHLVVKVDWKEGAVFSPPTGWFHQHLNTGPQSARHVAVRYGSPKYPVGFWEAHGKAGAMISTRQGGTLIEYEDEDPEIGRQYRQVLAEAGIECQMPEQARRDKENLHVKLDLVSSPRKQSVTNTRGLALKTTIRKGRAGDEQGS